MLKRKILRTLDSWRLSGDKKALIIKGCRQCGKTYSVVQFAKRSYAHVVYINFFENPSFAKAFDGAMSVDEIVMQLSVLVGNGARFVPGRTCIILDEIQECPRARMALKFFVVDGRYDVIGTGSLLGVSGYRDGTPSVPVGYETVVNMYPLDFEEFLWASGIDEAVIDDLVEHARACRPVPEPLHSRMHELLLHYVVVGGMPDAVNRFIETKQLNLVLQVQRDIVNGYRDDMVKYAERADRAKIRDCFDAIPRQLSRENKKFQYSQVKRGGTASRFEGSIKWIEDAGIICRCYNLTLPELPLSGNAIENIFKVYMVDIGLFVSMLEDGTQADILGGSLLGYKGAIFENLLADMLSKAGRRLYYFHKDSGLEIDFVIRHRGECALLECKATTGNAKSVRTVLSHPEKYSVRKAFKLGRYNIGEVSGVTTWPLYLGFVLGREESL